MPATPAATSAFWRWFQSREDELLAVESGQEPVCDALMEQLHAIADELTFQFGPVHDGRREFVISADGIRDAFPAVEALADAAPPLARWTVTRFRPGLPGPHRLRIGPIEIASDECLVRAEPDDDRTGLTIALPGFRPTPAQAFEQAGFILLDMSLGEYLVETRIGFIEFTDVASRPAGEWVPLDHFAEALKREAGPVR